MKKIICVLLALLLLVPVPVQAAGGDDFVGKNEEQEEALQKVPPAGKDESGHYTSGYMYIKVRNDSFDSSHPDRVTIYAYTYTSITAKDGEYLYVTYNPDNEGYYVQNWKSAHLYTEHEDTHYPGYIRDNDLGFGDNCGTNLVDMTTQSMPVFVTNLPVFDVNDTAAIAAYLASGDTSNAKNKDDLDYIEAAPDDEISVPVVNVINKGDYVLTTDDKLTLGNVSVGWQTEQKDDIYDLSIRGYFYLYKDKLNIDWASLISGAGAAVNGVVVKDIKGAAGGIAAAVNAFGNSPALISAGLAGWFPPVSVKADNSGSSNYEFSTSAITKYINDYLTTQPNCSDYFISKFEVRVRHRIGNKYSKWRVCTIDYTAGGDGEVKYDTRDDKDVVYSENDSTEDSSSTTETDVNVSGGNGSGDIVINIDNSNENTNTNTNTNNNSNSNNDVLDQVINAGGGSGDNDGNDGNGIDWSFGDLLGFLKGGFGLLGNSGFIALMSAVFPFLPAEIFTILTIGVAAAVVIMIINLLKRLFS